MSLSHRGNFITTKRDSASLEHVSLFRMTTVHSSRYSRRGWQTSAGLTSLWASRLETDLNANNGQQQRLSLPQLRHPFDLAIPCHYPGYHGDRGFALLPVIIVLLLVLKILSGTKLLTSNVNVPQRSVTGSSRIQSHSISLHLLSDGLGVKK